MSNSRLKSFIDRVLRLKEEEDAIKADIREVYAEMKGEGFDKTVAGQLVAHLRKVEKKGRDEVDNANAIFDLYLNEYENGTGIATRAHTHENSYSSEKATVMDRATENSFETGSAAAENARKASPTTADGSVSHAGAGESPATVSPSSTVPQAPLSVDEKSRDAALPSVSAPSSGQE
ncbi:DUF2312 domain-containing protein [Brucella intermedia]|uniref:DUF2312 domain-containing protein n=1 Tax=Brucella intermedia TaxID=94625 RepID=UPI0025521A32|nr:DUF2312 domain-containing protein [Brucella intermedia]MDL2203544.1 DUF2312 domain-containing protein [Brucella intermedia]